MKNILFTCSMTNPKIFTLCVSIVVFFFVLCFLIKEYKVKDSMSFTSHGQNVVLVLDKGHIYRYENGEKLVGTDKKGNMAGVSLYIVYFVVFVFALFFFFFNLISS